jgi:hypothetical protein
LIKLGRSNIQTQKINFDGFANFNSFDIFAIPAALWRFAKKNNVKHEL